MNTRSANPTDIDELARIWCEGWHDGHAHVVSQQMIRVRTPENFRQRVEESYRDMGVIGEIGAPTGFHIVKHDELSHLYVSRQARGSGIATALLDDAERRIANTGAKTAWLACAVGNDRAARFYEKYGWGQMGTVVIQVDTPVGLMPLNVWRYEKTVSVAQNS